MHLEHILGVKRKMTFELECQGKDKTIIPFLVHSVQMRNEKNEIIGAFFTMTDLSEVKYKELQLMEINNMHFNSFNFIKN